MQQPCRFISVVNTEFLDARAEEDARPCESRGKVGNYRALESTGKTKCLHSHKFHCHFVVVGSDRSCNIVTSFYSDREIFILDRVSRGLVTL